MENFNKVLSFVLGLVVVIVFVIVLSGRLNLRGGIFSKNSTVKVTATPTPTPVVAEEKKGFFQRVFSRRATPTPTRSAQPTPTSVVVVENPTPTPTAKVVAQNPTPGQPKGGNVQEIPQTGLPSAMLPLLGSSALLGVYLRKRK